MRRIGLNFQTTVSEVFHIHYGVLLKLSIPFYTRNLSTGTLPNSEGRDKMPQNVTFH